MLNKPNITYPEPGWSIDTDEMYLPGIIIKTKCPHCDSLVEIDLGNHYLSYPLIGEEDSVEVSHEYIDTDGDISEHVWDLAFELHIRIKVL